MFYLPQQGKYGLHSEELPMIKSNFEDIMYRVVYGATTKEESKKLQKLAHKITKVPDSITIPKEYLTGINND